ncbi:Gep3p [Lachancea thermotolerans CBS 6340]|uniref:Genetic interactor of prohibitins 3, mitochondrial n=1 Tax=Lachancea thermotolerans (strain ATCC 56472 / CBS 6340 / NRRL Y-8284) TaxID=559295 RepID=GEP3_LACTC|nr:KLTH0D09878p [Lachancea thermotolerans CBS 6340]C5DEU6.1 RecName: Full=Genetic interactor of prohibitins 3, mitochondrial; AltName: Full=Found in mitochondrial proteome protein 38; Flags: Precursor [Lachancea thermotolerans CBS 6340]CAR22701.1 KLTH0D09878p [Lachancea thermotolerans CBS 6340]
MLPVSRLCVRSSLRKLVFVRFVSCTSCGVTLQNNNVRGTGFYTPPKAQIERKRPVIEDLKYLLFSQDLQSLKSELSAEERPKKNKPLICKRCNDALHHNTFSKEDFRRYSMQEVYRHVPAGADIYHVVPLTDFPLQLNSAVLKDSRYNSALLLSKGDQVTPDKSLLQRKAPQFFKDMLRLKMNYNSNKSIAFSASKGWNIQSVYSVLRSNSFLIGCPNSGKSTLVNALLKKFPSLKPSEGNNASEAEIVRGAGVSNIPNMTRDLQSYNIGSKVINDLPGYSTNYGSPGPEDALDAKVLEKIQKTHLFKKTKLVKQRYTSLKGTDAGRCYTVSGIFYLVPPPDTINQVVNYIPGNERQYRNIDKALSVVNSEHACPEKGPLRQYVGVQKAMESKDNYVRHVLPPFQGSIEVVLKEIGYFQLKTTGKYKFLGLHEVWVPKGVDVCIREPIARLIDEGYEGYLSSEGKKKAIPEKREVFSATYPMSFEETDTLQKMKEMFLERTKNDVLARKFISSNPLKIIGTAQKEAPNLYWYYKW